MKKKSKTAAKKNGRSVKKSRRKGSRDNPVLEQAKSYRLAGLSIVPVKVMSKAGDVRFPENMSRYFSVRPNEKELEALFAGTEDDPEIQLAVLCGDGSGLVHGHVEGYSSLEVLEFLDDDTYRKWAKFIDTEAPGLLVQLPAMRSISGTRQIFYRSGSLEGTSNLAWALDAGSREQVAVRIIG